MTKMKIGHHRVIEDGCIDLWILRWIIAESGSVLNAVSDSLFLMKKWFHFKSKRTGSIGACRLVVVL